MIDEGGRRGRAREGTRVARFSVALALAVALGACARGRTERARPAEDAALAPDAPIAAGRVIVWTASGAPLPPDVLARHGLTKERDLSGGAGLYRISGIDAQTPDARAKTLAAIDALRKEPLVRVAEPDAVVSTQ